MREKMSSRSVTAVILGVGAVIVAGGVAMAAGSSSPTSKLPVSQADALTQPEAHPEDDFYLGVAPEGFQPKVSAEQAVSVASSQEALGSATSIQPTLATLTMPHFQPVDPKTDQPIGPPYIVDEPVWVVTADGICAAGSGGGFITSDGAKDVLPSPDPCAYHEAKIIVNATTGEMIIEATFRGQNSTGG